MFRFRHRRDGRTAPSCITASPAEQPADFAPFLLIDSGAQYEDGTTDVTRTIAIAPHRRMRDRFTRVLRGHIAIARAIFPDGTTGAQLDSFARQFLWQAGLDFEHGTGHGVGSYLSVHEGPARISKLGTTPLKRGMILSNEPGYYNRRLRHPIETSNSSSAPRVIRRREAGDAFETLTLAPIDRRLIDVNMLSATELKWLKRLPRARQPRGAPASRRHATKLWLERRRQRCCRFDRHPPLSSPRRREPSTPRPIGSSLTSSGYWITRLRGDDSGVCCARRNMPRVRIRMAAC